MGLVRRTTQEGRFLWKVSKQEFLVFAVVFFAALFLGVEPALVIGILIHWVIFMSRSAKIQVSVLSGSQQMKPTTDDSGEAGQAQGRESKGEQGDVGNTEERPTIFTDVSRSLMKIRDGGTLHEPAAVRAACASRDPLGAGGRHLLVAVIRFPFDIFFGNSDVLRKTVSDLSSGTGDALAAVVIDCSFVSSVDTSAVHALESIAGELAKPGRLRPPLCLAACREGVRAVLQKSTTALHELGEVRLAAHIPNTAVSAAHTRVFVRKRASCC